MSLVLRPAAVILGLRIATAPHTADRSGQPRPSSPTEVPATDRTRIQDSFGR